MTQRANFFRPQAQQLEDRRCMAAAIDNVDFVDPAPAFDSGFTGGVRVAAGDVNGDGVADIITGAGAGGGPHVVVEFSRGNAAPTVGDSPEQSDPLGAANVDRFFAYDPAFTGGVRVGAGDVTGDGHADIITAPGPGGGPHVRVFDGSGQ